MMITPFSMVMPLLGEGVSEDGTGERNRTCETRSHERWVKQMLLAGRPGLSIGVTLGCGYSGHGRGFASSLYDDHVWTKRACCTVSGTGRNRW